MLKLALIALVLGVAGCGIALDKRIKARTAKALVEHPPTGQILDVNGTPVHVHIEGKGPDVILIHGAGGNWQDFTFSLIPKLKGEFRLIAIDRPAHGHTGRIANRKGDVESLNEQADLIHATARLLGAEKPLILGQSYGGAVALAYALRHPDDSAGLLIVSGVSNPWNGDLDIWYRLTDSWFGRNVLIPMTSAFANDQKANETLEAIFAPDPAPEGYLEHMGYGLAIRPSQLKTNAMMVNTLLPQIKEQSRHYGDLKLPVEIIHGTADTIVGHDIHALPLSKQLPDARLTTLEGVGHMPHHADEPSTIAALRRLAKRAGLQ
ncbi:pimeloyl-ACP methyl ester carboxylesterase [Litoreibacter halocynthiae]|uniref:Pimeloyl-ACP methyl ester carboxylesterase n=1 Tax=Litoreibacter halocynthiae TaxID=1242689 RepID=A0A4V3EYM9_9RHOB|nr:alpha/beta hydrolase [Litoreibacter halocynthiae]TDT77635.1 pimeloyl-ACP methyl ester carboxylesterase [Litoreibacter halocynthiae]